jgi:hypothetical protein
MLDRESRWEKNALDALVGAPRLLPRAGRRHHRWLVRSVSSRIKCKHAPCQFGGGNQTFRSRAFFQRLQARGLEFSS